MFRPCPQQYRRSRGNEKMDKPVSAKGRNVMCRYRPWFFAADAQYEKQQVGELRRRLRSCIEQKRGNLTDRRALSRMIIRLLCRNGFTNLMRRGTIIDKTGREKRLNQICRYGVERSIFQRQGNMISFFWKSTASGCPGPIPGHGRKTDDQYEKYGRKYYAVHSRKRNPLCL